MIWKPITLGILLAIFYYLIKRSLRKKGIEQNLMTIDNSSHRDIKEFGNLIISNRKKIKLELQNQIFHFITEAKLFNIDYEYMYDDEFEKEFFENNSNIDLNSVKRIFYSCNHDNEGAELLTDKSGTIFLYDFNYGEPKLKKLFNSIWDIFNNKELLAHQIEKADNVLFHSKIETLDNFVNTDDIIKFNIEGFEIKDYKNQLEELFCNSKKQLNLDNFTWEEYEWRKVEIIECLICINGLSEKVKIESLGWYDFKFLAKINIFLEKLNSSYRISFVHENTWDEIYGVKLSNLDEFELLKKNMLIVE